MTPVWCLLQDCDNNQSPYTTWATPGTTLPATAFCGGYDGWQNLPGTDPNQARRSTCITDKPLQDIADHGS